MPFTREGYISPDEGVIRGRGCQCSDAQLELVGCDCRAEALSVHVDAADPSRFMIKFMDWRMVETVCVAGIATRELALDILDELASDPSINCADPVRNYEEHVLDWQGARYAAYLDEHESDPSLAAAELAADRGPELYDPEAQLDLEIHDALHPFGYGRDEAEPPVFLIHNETTGEWAGFRFPRRTSTERPDAREFVTRQEAVNALAAARAEFGQSHLLDGFAVVEE